MELLAQHLKLPDVWQHQAVEHLRAGTDVIVNAPTGAGKTYIFELLHESKTLKGQAVYTVPTRALANDKYSEWKAKGWDVGIATGDLSENIHAPVIVATLETQVERLMSERGPAVLVIDEYQMIADENRGANYEAAVALAPQGTTLLLLSGSVANAREVCEWLRRIGRTAEVVETKHRPVPLEDVALENLPGFSSQRYEGWWAKMLATVMMNDLAPLLIFAPRRAEAETIARALARDLPPGEPLILTPEQRNVCGRELSQLIEKRVAFHHSGLSYGARAGVIEPLAKAGQLRCIVATLGLAAGINFSVRSVHVSATKYRLGDREMTVEPDALLQMFGRAGRRGLDTKGSVITVHRGAGLAEARPARLCRGALLAWPIFLRVMRHAALRNDSPFIAAKRFAGRLFAKDPPPLGLEGELREHNPFEQMTVRDGTALFGLEARDEQILNSQGKWEPLRHHRDRTVRMGDAWVATPDRQGPALADSQLMLRLSKGIARLAKIGKQYMFEIALGVAGEGDIFAPTKALRKLLRLNPKVDDMSCDEFFQQHRAKVARKLVPEGFTAPGALGPAELPKFLEFFRSGNLLLARYDLSPIPVRTYADSTGRPLLNVVQRLVAHENVTKIELPDAAEPMGERHAFDPPRGSVVHSWRALGLIDAHGVPTLRGQIVSMFQGGEGLAVAAALEDDTYPVEDLVEHMANLRAGFRLELDMECDSERLGAVCRHAYGFVTHHGYLNQGLPLEYADGGCEVIMHLIQEGTRGNRSQLPEGFSEGDLARAYLEWVSLIRHVSHAPNHEWPRWMQLKAACTTALDNHGKTLRHLFRLDLPTLTNKQRQTHVKHVLLPKRWRDQR